MTDGLVPWAPVEAARLGRETFTAHHGLVGHPLFDDDVLARLLDDMPRGNLQVFTMGEDPAATEDWRRGDAPDVSGEQLLAAVGRGRLWLNVVRVDSVDRRFADLLHELFTSLEGLVSGLKIIDGRATLLISSPGAQVYYHADAQPNLLWQVRGVKRLWVYPALDPDFVSTDDLGRIFTGETDEQLPYDPAFDASARVVELRPGEVASWPQNAPHRVSNVEGVNVSLSTEYITPETARRAHVRGANRMLNRFSIPVRSTRETGFSPTAKAYLYRLARRAKVGQITPAGRPVQFHVSPDEAVGYAPVAPSTGP
ncbi:MAG: cupin-like domain-containing protein [Actinomycetota bacterium]